MNSGVFISPVSASSYLPPALPLPPAAFLVYRALAEFVGWGHNEAMRSYQEILSHSVSSLPLRDLVAVTPDTPVREVLDKLRAKRLGCAAVVDKDGKPLGVFTEKLVTRTVCECPGFIHDAVGNHLEDTWAAVTAKEPVAAVLRTLRMKGLRFVCVIDQEGKAVSLTGQKGLMEYLAQYFPRHVQMMVHRIGREAISARREGA